jgi:hypothetical protein
VIRRTLAIMLTATTLATTFGFRAVGAQTSEDSQRSEKVRAKVIKLGEGPKAHVEVKLRDRTKVKGYVSKAEKDAFTVTDSNTGASRTLAYADVTEVKHPGGGISKRTWIIVGVSAAAAVLIVGLTVIRPYYCNEVANCH